MRGFIPLQRPQGLSFISDPDVLLVGEIDDTGPPASWVSKVNSVDISDPDNPTVIDTLSSLTGLRPNDIVVDSNDIAYVAGGDVAVVDASDPNNLTSLALIEDFTIGPTTYNLTAVYGIAIDGTDLYVADTVLQGIVSFDVSTPASPVFQDFHVDTPTTQEFWQLLVQGNTLYAYASDFVGFTWNEISTFDITDPTNISTIATKSDSRLSNAQAWGNTLANFPYWYTNRGDDWFSVWDLSDPSNITLAGDSNLASRIDIGSADSLIALDSDRVLIAGHDALWFYDVSDPTTPTLDCIREHPLLNCQPLRMVSNATHAFFTQESCTRNPDEQEGLLTVALSAAPCPTTLTHLSGADLTDATNLPQVSNLTILGNHAFCTMPFTNRLTSVDLSNLPTSMSVDSSLVDSAFTGGLDGIAAFGTDKVVACNSTNNRVVVVDVSNPSSMSVLGSVTASPDLGGAYDVAVKGSYAYVACTNGRMTVVDLTTPSSPSVHATLTGTEFDFPVAIVINGNNAYVGNDNPEGIVSIDVSNPASPSVQDTLTTSDDPSYTGIYGLATWGNYLASTSWTNNSAVLTITDISNPAIMALAGKHADHPTHQAEWGVALYQAGCGMLAMVTSGDTDSWSLLDLRTPSTPTKIDDEFNVDSGNQFMIETYLNYGITTRGGQNRLEVVEIT